MIFFYQFLSDRLEKREWRRKKAHIPKRKELILKKKRCVILMFNFKSLCFKNCLGHLSTKDYTAIFTRVS